MHIGQSLIDKSTAESGDLLGKNHSISRSADLLSPIINHSINAASIAGRKAVAIAGQAYQASHNLRQSPIPTEVSMHKKVIRIPLICMRLCRALVACRTTRYDFDINHRFATMAARIFCGQ